ncbi:putative mediator of RNA polymerase II transcription subunit 26 [Montipora capricornis]|uniref:putative mediator of RNA polymerase II transcription subunit 26 n=1 Tax=Montipora capricornis TaxID=246305 RepID=UPI0035F17B75
MPVLIERTHQTKGKLRAVYAYIRRQREKGKQALAESKAKEEEERQRKREEEKKKETVEDVKKEIAELEAKLEQLKQKKHDLFSQFKKALNYEDEVRRQQEIQALKTAGSVNSRTVQGLSTVQGPIGVAGQTQIALGDVLPCSGAVKRQGSPPHPLSGYIQAQISHFQQPPHVGYPPQATQGHQAAQERYAGYQHSQGHAPGVSMIGSQLESHLPGKQHTPSVGAASEVQHVFPRQLSSHQGGLPQQENQIFSAHQLQQQPHQQQFTYHMQQQQPSYHYVQHGNQKQSLLPRPQALQQSNSAQHGQGSQHGYPVTLSRDPTHHQSYHGSNMHPVHSQQEYQVHSHPQGYQEKQPVGYQSHQIPPSSQHPYHPQTQQQPPMPSQYPVTQGHQGPQEQVPRQQAVTPQQYHQRQGANQSDGHQSQYEGTHQSQLVRTAHQQQLQHQKQDQRPSSSLGYSQNQVPNHPPGVQSAKRSSHKYAPYPISGSKGHHQGSAGKKYLAKYQSSSEGVPSAGSYSGPSGSSSSSHSRHHHHHQSRSSHKGPGTGHSSSSQQKSSRYHP